MLSPAIQKLVDLFSRFPTVGPRTAARFVYYLIRMPQDEFGRFVETLENLKESVKKCYFCLNPFESDSGGQNLCQICRDPGREKNILSIVERETDIEAIEKTKKYKGLYFVAGGPISPSKKEMFETLQIKELEERIKEPAKFLGSESNFDEIILAINPTTEGEAAALFIERRLKEIDMPPDHIFKITRLARGLPSGGELEYADPDTLGSSFEQRK